MPRYLIETSGWMRLHCKTAARLVAHRFPELTFEYSGAAEPTTSGRDEWLCRAPSEAHVRRWAAAAGVCIQALRRVDAEELAAN